MQDLTTIQRMNREAVEQHKYGDWRDTIDLEEVRKWFSIPAIIILWSVVGCMYINKKGN